MQLLKVRNFSDMFTDTFQFIKHNIGHFLLNYIIINGIFLLASLVLNYLSNSSMNPENPNFGSNTVITIMLLALIGVISNVISFSYVPIYMILYHEKGSKNFDYRTILAYGKAHLSKIALYFVLMLVMMIPLGIAFYLGFFILAITIVGIFALPLFFAAFALWVTLTFYEFLFTDKQFFDALGHAFTLFTKKFWATTATIALIFTIVMIVYGFIMGAVGVGQGFMNMNVQDVEDIKTIFTMFKSPAFLITATIMGLLTELAYISFGIIYFSQKEQLENINTQINIDEIGQA